MNPLRGWKIAGAAAAAAALSLLVGCPLAERQLIQEDQGFQALARRVEVIENDRLPVLARSDVEIQRRLGEISDKSQPGAELADLRNQLEDLRSKVSAAQGQLDDQARVVGQRLGNLETKAAAPDKSPGAVLEARLSEMEKRVRILEENASRLPEPAASDKSGLPSDKASPAESLYQDAYALLKKQGKQQEARDKFLQFVKTYPDDPYVPNAYFWIGESYFDQGDYEKAVLQYDEVVNKFPKSNKVPSALLKEAYAFDAMKDRETARAILKKLIKENPSSDAAGIAKKKLETFGE